MGAGWLERLSHFLSSMSLLRNIASDMRSGIYFAGKCFSILFEHRIFPKTGSTFGSDVLARFPLERNRSSDKKSRKIKTLERILVAKVCQLLRNSL